MHMRKRFNVAIRGDQRGGDKLRRGVDVEFRMLLQEHSDNAKIFFRLGRARAVHQHSTVLHKRCSIFDEEALKVDEVANIFSIALEFHVGLFRKHAESGARSIEQYFISRFC